MIFIKLSRQSNIITLTENVQGGLDDKKFACGVFIDTEEAFYTVNHNILLSKDNYLKKRVTANDWFKSYLSKQS